MIWSTVFLLCATTFLLAFGQDQEANGDIDHLINRIHKQYTRAMCQGIHNFNCSNHVVYGDERICGSDGIDYSNKCYFAKARCFFPNLGKAHKGLCSKHQVTHNDHITTFAPSTVTWGHDPGLDVVKDVFCDNINTIQCGNVVDADICATDGKMYKNQCLFAKVKCFEPNLEVTNPAKCGEHGLPVQSTIGPQIVG